MQTFIEVFFSLFAALGIFSLIWLILGKIVAQNLQRAPVVSVVLGFGSGADLEQAVNGLKWMRNTGSSRYAIVIADAGLNEEGKRLALRLAEKENWVRFLPITELMEWMSSSYLTIK